MFGKNQDWNEVKSLVDLEQPDGHKRRSKKFETSREHEQVSAKVQIVPK